MRTSLYAGIATIAECFVIGMFVAATAVAAIASAVALFELR
jgi:hypothetical protein